MDAGARCILPIPCRVGREEAATALSRYTDWFYAFEFDNGASTRGPDAVTEAIHRTRAELILPAVDAILGSRWPSVRCLDIACHQGWFAVQIAVRGAREVVGIDIRDRHVEMATAIKRLGGLETAEFRTRNVYDLRADQGQYDLTLLLGLLYHLDDPFKALRIARSLTRELCVIECQLARGPALDYRWGSDAAKRSAPGMAVIPGDPSHVEPGQSVAFVPTLEALYEMAHAAGFDRLYLCVPSRSMYEQYVSYDRVVVLAHVLP